MRPLRLLQTPVLAAGPWFVLALAALLAGCQSLAPQAAAVAPAPPPATAAAKPVELSNTFAHELVAQGSGRRYTLWVWTPPQPEPSDKPLPVVFVADAPYNFPMIRSVAGLVGARGRNIEPFILVGLGYEVGGGSRNRDYTPTNPLRHAEVNRAIYQGTSYGEAAAYRDFVERQVFPFVAQNYRADMGRKVYLGASYGGLFGAYTLLTKPAMFQTYLLGSPSLWFDGREIWRLEAEYAKYHKDLPAQVLLYTGSFETPRPEPRYTREMNLLGDMLEFERLLQSRRYPSLTIQATALADEDHRTMGPGFATRGLLRALPGFGPYDPE